MRQLERDKEPLELHQPTVRVPGHLASSVEDVGQEVGQVSTATQMYLIGMFPLEGAPAMHMT
jgi:hypothetical protein